MMCFHPSPKREKCLKVHCSTGDSPLDCNLKQLAMTNLVKLGMTLLLVLATKEWVPSKKTIKSMKVLPQMKTTLKLKLHSQKRTKLMML